MKNFKNNIETKTKQVVMKAGMYFDHTARKVKALGAYLSLMLMTAPCRVFAGEESVPDADAAWNMVMQFLITWIPRLGGVMLFLGAIEFAVAYKNEDANSKTNATRLMISGAMVIAVPLALKSLLMTSGS